MKIPVDVPSSDVKAKKTSPFHVSKATRQATSIVVKATIPMIVVKVRIRSRSFRGTSSILTVLPQ
jgi:hypothetical protein